MAQRCVAATRDPRVLPAAAVARLDGRVAYAFPGAADLHFLGLLSPALAKELRAANRSSVTEPFTPTQTGRCRRGCLGAWTTGRQRPRPGLGAFGKLEDLTLNYATALSRWQVR